MASYAQQNGVDIISLDNPPQNLLSLRTRKFIYEYVKKASSSSSSAVILCGKGVGLSAGVDIGEFGKTGHRDFPTLLDLTSAIEDCCKPVIAAIHGYAFSGGLELALACHYRIAKSNAKFGFPSEVLIGLIPAAGGTQRFPRLAGVTNAMEWTSGGKLYTANASAKIGLLDRVVPPNADIVSEAIQFSKTLANINLANRRVSLMKIPNLNTEDAEEIAGNFVRLLHKKSRGAFAPLACIEAVRYAAKSTFEQGMKKELELARMLLDSGQSRASIYAFLAEREGEKWTVPGTNKNSWSFSGMPVKLGAVIGLGTMGRGIAVNLLRARIPVIVLEMNEKSLEQGFKDLNSVLDDMVRWNHITSENRLEMKSSITATMDYSKLSNVDIVIEAVFEDLLLKKTIFQRLDKVCKPSAILATNTSALDIDVIAAVTQRPDKVMGMHFFAPANLMRLLENIPGAKTSGETIATCMEMGKKMRKVTVLVGNCHGFVGNRMYIHYMNESDYLLEEGAYPETVDKALTDYGFVMGRYLAGDISGNDVYYRVRHSSGLTMQQNPGKDPRNRNGIRYCPLADYLYEKGRYGTKRGAGWYDFGTNKRPVPSPEITKMIESYRSHLDIVPKRIDSQEILERMLYPLINEGFKILEEGFASSPMDIDMVWIHGYAWPKHTGGPMYYSSTVGLPKLLERIRYFHSKFGQACPHWIPSKMLIGLAEEYGNPPIEKWMEYFKALSNEARSNL